MNQSIEAEKLVAALKIKDVPNFKDIEEVRQYVTDLMVEKYDLGRASRINNGYCFIWAFLVWALWSKPEEVDFVSTSDHVVIKVGGYYYDSEGSSRDVGNVGRSNRKLNVAQMTWYWARCGYKRVEFSRLVKKVAPLIHKKAVGRYKVSQENSKWLGVSDIPEIA